jgi:hypothetical protein
MVGTALFFFGIAFFVLGLIGLGRGKLGEGGVVFTWVGVIDGIIGLYMTLAGKDPFTGTLVLLFAITWLTAGWTAVKEYGLVPLGNLCLFNAIMTALYCSYFWSGGAITFGITTLLWVWAFLSVTLVAYGKIPLKVMGWTFLIESFITLLVPAWFLLADIPLP